MIRHEVDIIAPFDLKNVIWQMFKIQNQIFKNTFCLQSSEMPAPTSIFGPWKTEPSTVYRVLEIYEQAQYLCDGTLPVFKKVEEEQKKKKI